MNTDLVLSLTFRHQTQPTMLVAANINMEIPPTTRRCRANYNTETFVHFLTLSTYYLSSQPAFNCRSLFLAMSDFCDVLEGSGAVNCGETSFDKLLQTNHGTGCALQEEPADPRQNAVDSSKRGHPLFKISRVCDPLNLAVASYSQLRHRLCILEQFGIQKGGIHSCYQ